MVVYFQRNHFAGDSFFVVLTVLPTNYDCKGMMIIKPPGQIRLCSCVVVIN